MSTDTLDDLRVIWNEPQVKTTKAPALHLAIAEQWRARDRKIRLKFILELALTMVIYTGAIILIIQASSNTMSQVFGIKIVLLSLIFVGPVGISLYQSLSFIRTMDMSTPMTSYLNEAIEKLRKSERLYVQYTYLFNGFMIVLLVTDDYFMGQPAVIQYSAFGLIMFSVLLVRPYLNATYGRDRRHFEKIREDLEGAG